MEIVHISEDDFATMGILTGLDRCPSHEGLIDLNAFVENSMNRMFPLTYTTSDSKMPVVLVHLDAIAAVTSTTCKMLRILHEGNLIQFMDQHKASYNMSEL
nr:unnamed protein product [Spirometra erinaceieuropaei]